MPTDTALRGYLERFARQQGLTLEALADSARMTRQALSVALERGYCSRRQTEDLLRVFPQLKAGRLMGVGDVEAAARRPFRAGEGAASRGSA